MSSFTKKLDSIRIPLKDIKDATNNFADENLIRQEGGKRKIYRGLLQSRSEQHIVAVRFDPKNTWRRKTEFMKEITMLCGLKHQNLASIVGFCEEDGEMIIITKLEPKGSLDQYLSDPVTLTWTQRLQICLGIARALSYIHYYKGRNFSVIHTNVKSSKILLDDKWEPKLFGFGLSKVQPAARRQGLVLDQVISGTPAYLDPAYVTLGGVTHKSDVYSFGVVLFEVLSGKKAFEGRTRTTSLGSGQPPSLGSIQHPSFGSGQPPSLGSIQHPSFGSVQHPSFGSDKPPSLSMIRPEISQTMLKFWNDSNSAYSYDQSSFVDDLPEEYMSTKRSLKGWQIPEDGVLLAKLAQSHYKDQTLDDIIHPGLRKQMDPQSLKKFSEAAYCCLNNQRSQRPNIDRVIFSLKQALELQLAREQSIAAEAGASTAHLKGKDFEHLRIGLDAIRRATENFDNKYCIGSGGFGVVYRADSEHFDSFVMKDNNKSEAPKKCSTVAIKCITKREDTQGEQGFIAEIETLSTCRHPNIVSLLGFCHEDSHMILVYELITNGSLDDYLGMEGKMTNLTWMQRIKICIDIAQGLDYIHTTMDNKRKIIHRDIKSANILLDENLQAKIADFGLSRFHPLNHANNTIITNMVVGTKVYIDPEYASTGHLKKESDVYSFGVVLFELLTGTLAYDLVYTDENDNGLAPIIRQHFKSKGTLKEMLDPKLQEESYEKGFTLSKGPNKESLHIFSKIGYHCLSEKQEHRPTMKAVIKELQEALKCQEAHKDGLRMSLEEIKWATQNFNNKNMIGRGGFGTVYRGEIFRDKDPILIVAKKNDKYSAQGEQEFLTELEILFEYKHENIISLVGYCDENKERISVFEYASNGSLDAYVDNASLTWMKRLMISIDVAMGLHFLHGGGSQKAAVIHRDIKSSNILLTSDWKAKISDFGLSKITAIDNEIDLMVDDACGTFGYVDPQYVEKGFFMRESDIYSFGVVLFEIMCGRTAYSHRHYDLVHLVKRHYEEGTLDELVFKDIKNMIVPASLRAYQSIAYECLHYEREKQPTASMLVSKLKEALRFQEDIEIWKEKLPKDSKEIIKISKTPDTLSNLSNKELYEKLSEGILLKRGKSCLSVNNNGERNEIVSATMFSYENKILHKPISLQNSRFKRVVKSMDITNLRIQIKIKTQLLSPNVIYGAHLVFKFCDPRKFSSKLIYVNLKYKMGSETLHAYFATHDKDEWMTIELCRFISRKKDINFKVLLESLSRYYCGSGAIYVEGILFRAIDDATFKVKPNSDSVQQLLVDYDEINEITQLEDDEKSFSPSIGNEKSCHMLPAKMVLYPESSNVKCFKWKSLAEPESRFLEVAELLSRQVFRIKCKIETQKLSPDTDYACYLVFKLSQKCHGLQCPVKVRDVLLRKNKEFKFLYLRSPKVVNLHTIEWVPKLREDGLMEVIVWKFNSGNTSSDDHHPMSLKLRCYEGTMSGLVVYGIEFRHV
ncbi:hypothetical protein R6Q57_003861 [Mikania cordata]